MRRRNITSLVFLNSAVEIDAALLLHACLTNVKGNYLKVDHWGTFVKEGELKQKKIRKFRAKMSHFPPQAVLLSC